MPDFPKPPKPPRKSSQSYDSFPALTDNDRALMNNVLKAAMEASEQVKQSNTSHGKLLVRLGDHDEAITAIREEIVALKETHADLRALQTDIRTLNKNVMANLREDAQRERMMGELKLEMTKLSAEAGRDAGRSAGRKSGVKVATLISGFATILWLIVWIWAVATGRPPPELPEPHAPAATSLNQH